MTAHLEGFSKRRALTILAMALVTILTPLAARAQCVTNLYDSGPGSLRSCIQPGATVTFARPCPPSLRTPLSAARAPTCVPSSGYTFKNWTGNVAKTTSAATTVTMTAPETVTANFTKK